MESKDLIKRAKEDEVKFISLQFSDVTGAVKSVDLPVSGLEDALAKEFLGQCRQGQVRMLPPQRQEGLGRGGIEGALLAAVAAGLIVEGGELTVFEAVEPVLEGVGGEEAPIPGLLGGFVEGTGQGKSALARLQDRLDGGKASQSTAFTGIFGVRGGEGVHAPRVWARRNEVPEIRCVGWPR